MAAPSAVFTIARVAKMLDEDMDWLLDVALEMDPEDGCLTVYGVDDEGTTAFTPFGIENLKELICAVHRHRFNARGGIATDGPCPGSDPNAV
jgi:hypothetical protein